MVEKAGYEDTKREEREIVVEEPVEDSAAVEKHKRDGGKDLCTNSTHNTYTGRAVDSPGVVVAVVVVVEEAGGAVEREGGGWEVGGTAEDEAVGEGVADSAAVRGRGRGRKMCKQRGLTSLKEVKIFLKYRSTVKELHSQVVEQKDSHGMKSFCSSPKS